MQLIGTKRILITLGLLACVGVSTASAQRRVPYTGGWAFGASAGPSVPSDVSFDNGLALAANLERYVTPRVSIRGQLGGAQRDIINQRFTGTVKPIYFDGNVVYNWEGGQWHPYATGGIGIYHNRAIENGFIKGTNNRLGADLGGGIEYFFTRRSTITAEAIRHWVDHVDTPLARFTDGSFWTVTGGIKHYF